MTEQDKIERLERDIAGLTAERDELVDAARELLTIKAEINEHWGAQMDGRDRWPARLFRLMSDLRDRAESAESRVADARADSMRLAETMANASNALYVIRDAYMEDQPGAPEPTPLDLVNWVADAQPRSQKSWAAELAAYMRDHGIQAVLDDDGESVMVPGVDGDAMMLVPTNGDKVVITIPGHGIGLCRTTEEALAGVLGVLAASCEPGDLS